MAGHAAHEARGRVVDHSAQGRRVLVGSLGGRDARDPGCRRQEGGLFHSQRQENVLPGVFIQRHSAESVHQLAEQDEVDIAVDVPHARRPDGLGSVSQVETGLIAVPFRFDRHILRQSGKMREEIAQREVALAALKVGDVIGHLIVKAEAALFEELHQGRSGGDHLGERGAVEDGVHGHGFDVGDQGALSVRLAIDYVSLVPNQEHGAGETVLLDGLFDHTIDGRAAGKGLTAERRYRQRAAKEQLHVLYHTCRSAQLTGERRERRL